MRLEYIFFGRVLRPQGVRGQVKIGAELLEPATVKGLARVYLKQEDGYRPVDMTGASVRAHEGAVYAYLDGAADRNAAEAQRGWALYLRREDVRMPENHDLTDDLIGCRAVGETSGTVLGTLREVMHLPRNDVYVFDTPRGEMMLPALLQVIPRVDVVSQALFINEEKFPQMAVYQSEEPAK